MLLERLQENGHKRLEWEKISGNDNALQKLLSHSMPVVPSNIASSPIKDTTLDVSIPAPEEVIGSAIGSRHLFHHEILKYMRSLAEASPRMVSLEVHAKSYGGRDLPSFVISSEKNIDLGPKY